MLRGVAPFKADATAGGVVFILAHGFRGVWGWMRTAGDWCAPESVACPWRIPHHPPLRLLLLRPNWDVTVGSEPNIYKCRAETKAARCLPDWAYRSMRNAPQESAVPPSTAFFAFCPLSAPNFLSGQKAVRECIVAPPGGRVFVFPNVIRPPGALRRDSQFFLHSSGKNNEPPLPLCKTPPIYPAFPSSNYCL
jgi:hypothetical protein